MGWSQQSLIESPRCSTKRKRKNSNGTAEHWRGDSTILITGSPTHSRSGPESPRETWQAQERGIKANRNQMSILAMSTADISLFSSPVLMEKKSYNKTALGNMQNTKCSVGLWSFVVPMISNIWQQTLARDCSKLSISTKAYLLGKKMSKD